MFSRAPFVRNHDVIHINLKYIGKSVCVCMRACACVCTYVRHPAPVTSRSLALL